MVLRPRLALPVMGVCALLATAFTAVVHAAPVGSIHPNAPASKPTISFATVKETSLTLFQALAIGPMATLHCSQIPSVAERYFGDLFSGNSIWIFSPGGRQALIHISISPVASVNAFAVTESLEPLIASIVLTQGLLDSLKDKDELAFVLAHEWAHILQQDSLSIPPNLLLTAAQLEHMRKVQQLGELEADRLAGQLLNKQGYRSRAAIDLLSRLTVWEFPNPGENARRHPVMQERLETFVKHLP